MVLLFSRQMPLLVFPLISLTSNFFLMNFVYDANAATTLADVSSNYSAGNMITTGVAIVVLVAIICAVLFIVW